MVRKVDFSNEKTYAFSSTVFALLKRSPLPEGALSNSAKDGI